MHLDQTQVTVRQVKGLSEHEPTIGRGMQPDLVDTEKKLASVDVHHSEFAT